MRRLLALLLMASLALSGCLGGDDDTLAPDGDEDGDGFTNQEEEQAGSDPQDPESRPESQADPEPEDTLEDKGEYVLDTATGFCHAKAYDDPTGTGAVYVSGFGGGTWVIAETNGEPGLQLANNHPTAGSGLIFDLALDARCSNGDQVIA